MVLESKINIDGNSNYQKLAARLQEIAKMTESMTSKEISERWGESSLVWLQGVDNCMVYLRKEKRIVEKKREKVPQEYYEQTSGFDFPQLKSWYNPNEKLKHRQRELKKIVYTERMLELIAQKFDINIKPIANRGSDGFVKTSKDLLNLCDTDPKARYIIQLCQGDDVDVADIIAVVYDGKIARDDAIKLLQEPSLRDYLGEFRKPVGIPDIEEYANELLPLDKNGVIASIVYRRLIECRRNKLGAKPSIEQRKDFLEEVQRNLERLI